MKMTKTYKVGVIGASRGGGYLTAIKFAGERASLSGVYDPDDSAAEAFVQTARAPKKFSSFEQAVDESDILVIASPQQYHAPQAAYALDTGTHVLSEVPAAVSTQQVDELLAAARLSNAKYMLAENYGYTRNNLIVRSMARGGLFGDLYLGEAEYLHEMKQFHSDANGQPTWRHRWQVGRNGVTYPTHSLGPLLDWMDDRIVSVSCVGTGRWTDPEHELEDSVFLSARTRKGGLIRTRLDLLSNRPELWDYFALQGTEGAFEAGRGPLDQHKVYLEGRGPADKWQHLETFAEDFLPHKYRDVPEGSGHWGSDTWPFLEFLESIENDTTPPIDIHRALEMTLPGIASERSIAENGAWIHVPDPRTLTAGIGIGLSRKAPLA